MPRRARRRCWRSPFSRPCSWSWSSPSSPACCCPWCSISTAPPNHASSPWRRTRVCPTGPSPASRTYSSARSYASSVSTAPCSSAPSTMWSRPSTACAPTTRSNGTWPWWRAESTSSTCRVVPRLPRRPSDERPPAGASISSTSSGGGGSRWRVAAAWMRKRRKTFFSPSMPPSTACTTSSTRRSARPASGEYLPSAGAESVMGDQATVPAPESSAVARRRRVTSIRSCQALAFWSGERSR